jgi:hypothetical protein
LTAETVPAPGRTGVSAKIRAARWLMAAGVLVAVVVSAWSLHRVPHASWQPALLGLVPWVVGKYLLCPLRWHALSCSGRNRRWHLRVYAESELLGLASPGHLGADLWRMHLLQRTGMNRPSALAEVALDRLIGALGLTVFVVASGATLPIRVVAAAVGLAAGVLIVLRVVRQFRPGIFAGRPMPPLPVVLRGVAISIAYQLTIMGLLIGTVAAMGEVVHPLALLGVFGASQVAGILPGVNGASPREGALVVGLASVGVTWQAALGAVALTALLAWIPALLIGGAAFLVRRLQRPAVA